ncbi:homeobox and leucine zipper protein Homez isoform X2 [Mastomys coucha]|uniref:homeobox and leucine zipper protein Homez isoform X2 n=1 Tax=Mastomys coucha TaxID=35658 RepID=UPI001261893D|nr:homeobox and leucine zipper protein Homez isoform X2 [Mastomys coucha]
MSLQSTHPVHFESDTIYEGRLSMRTRPPGRAVSEGYKPEHDMSPNKDASSLNSSAVGLVCLPPVSEELQLVWTQATQTSELDGNEHLLQAFSYFPYPSLADIALLCLRHGLQMEKVKTWFMAQRLRCGISWSSEEIEETRARVVYHRDQLLFKCLLSFTHQTVRPPQEMPPVPAPGQVALGLSPLALSEPTHMKGLKVEPEEPSQVSQLPLNHQKVKEPLVMGSRTFSYQSDGQDLQISGLSKEQASRHPNQSCGGKTASRNHSTAVHQPDNPPLISLLDKSCKEESEPSGTPPSSSTSSPSFQVLANGTTATPKPLQPLGCISQSFSPSEKALSPQVEPLWPQRLRNNSVSSRVGPTEYLSPDMQHQRKTKRKTKEQLAILKSFFLQCQWARREDYHKLEQITGLPRPEIIQWFGDTRYALKHGQLKWFRDNAVIGTPSFQDPAIPTPSTHSLKEWAKTPPLPAPPPPPDIRPLEKYWAAHQQLQEADILKLSQASRLSTQQVLDWFDSRLPKPAEVVVCLDEEEQEEEDEELPEDGEEEEEEEEEDDDDDDDDVIIRD